MLNGQCLLFCPFIRCNPQCAQLVDQPSHDFAHNVKFLYFYTCRIYSKSGPLCDSVSEGQSVSLEVVWSCVHPSFRLQIQRNPLNTISLQVKQGAIYCTHTNFITKTPLMFSLSISVFVRSILCLVSLSLCSTPVKQRSL